MAGRDDGRPSVDWRAAKVTGGYHWSVEHQLAPLRQDLPAAVLAAPQGPWLIEPGAWGDEKRVRIENLHAQRHELHLEFTRLATDGGPETLEAIRRFANRFGPLGVHTAHVYLPAESDPEVVQLRQALGEKGVHSGRAPEDRRRHLYAAEHLSTWLEAISTVQGFAELVYRCRNNDREFLRAHVHWQRGPLRVGISYRWPGRQRDSVSCVAREDPGGLRTDKLHAWNADPYRIEHYVEPMLEYTYDELNQRLREHVAPRLDREYGVVLDPGSLLGILLMVTAEQLSGQWPLRCCPSCGAIFTPRKRSDQQTCSVACRKRLSRSRAEQGQE